MNQSFYKSSSLIKDLASFKLIVKNLTLFVLLQDKNNSISSLGREIEDISRITTRIMFIKEDMDDSSDASQKPYNIFIRIICYFGQNSITIPINNDSMYAELQQYTKRILEQCVLDSELSWENQTLEFSPPSLIEYYDAESKLNELLGFEFELEEDFI